MSKVHTSPTASAKAHSGRASVSASSRSPVQKMGRRDAQADQKWHQKLGKLK